MSKPLLFTKDFLEKELQTKSPGQIADENSTYTKKIQRLMTYYGIKGRSKSEATSLALKEGRIKHPTAGRERTEDEKMRIAKGLVDTYTALDQKEKERRTQVCKEKWDNRPPEKKAAMHQKAMEGIREASRTGSKLEKYINERLNDLGFPAYLHKADLINENLECDITISSVGVYIELDGLSHYEPIFGEEKLIKTMASDHEKNAIVIGSGGIMIRVKVEQSSESTVHRERFMVQLVDLLNSIKEKRPGQIDSLINITY
jgi:hypothetical protein